MIATSFKSVGWVAGVGAAALGCYMLSLQVASERAELASVEARIVRTQQAIRDLQTELGTRGRLSQLEQWNAEVLALSSPVAGQFVENEVVLARLDTRPAEFPGGEVRMASAEAPAPTADVPQVRTAAAQAPAAAQPQVRQAAAQAPAAARPQVRQAAAVATPAEPTAPVVRRAALTTPARPEARPAAARTQLSARTASLLDDRTARELGDAARAEREGSSRSERAAARPAARPSADKD